MLSLWMCPERGNLGCLACSRQLVIGQTVSSDTNFLYVSEFFQTHNNSSTKYWSCNSQNALQRAVSHDLERMRKRTQFGGRGGFISGVGAVRMQR
jgi:hypothetical protein